MLTSRLRGSYVRCNCATGQRRCGGHMPEPTRSRLARWRRSGGRQSAEGAVHDGGRRRRLPSLASLTVGSVGSSLRSQSLHVTCLWRRSEEHTSELQSLAYLVCRLLLEKKKNHRGTSSHWG